MSRQERQREKRQKEGGEIESGPLRPEPWPVCPAWVTDLRVLVSLAYSRTRLNCRICDEWIEDGHLKEGGKNHFYATRGFNNRHSLQRHHDFYHRESPLTAHSKYHEGWVCGVCNELCPVTAIQWHAEMETREPGSSRLQPWQHSSDPQCGGILDELKDYLGCPDTDSS